jgi:hypothetical protein
MLKPSTKTLPVLLLCLAIALVACSSSAPAPTASPAPAATVTSPEPVKAGPTVAPKAESQVDPTSGPSKEELGALLVPPKARGCSGSSLGESVLLGRFDRAQATHWLSAIDPASGLPLCGYEPIPGGLNTTFELSPDGGTLAMVVARTNNHRDGLLHLVDLPAWQDTVTAVEIPDWIGAMAFSPDGTRLAITYLDPEVKEYEWPKRFKLVLVDVASGDALAETVLDLSPRRMAFSAGGDALMVYGVADPDGTGRHSQPYALLLDAPGLEISWQQPLDGFVDGQRPQENHDEGQETQEFAWYSPAVVLSPEAQALYIVHAREAVLTAVDFAARDVRTVEIRPQLSWFERLLALTAGRARAKMMVGTTKQAVLSPDGERLYVVGVANDTYTDAGGNLQIKETPLGLQVVDTASGTEVAHLDVEGTEVGISPDGSRAFLRYWSQNLPRTQVVDLATMSVEAQLPGRWLVAGTRLDGAPVVLSANNLSAETALATLDAGSLEELHRWSVPGYAYWIVPGAPIAP